MSKDIVVHVPSPYLWDAVTKHEQEVMGNPGGWTGGKWESPEECIDIRFHKGFLHTTKGWYQNAKSNGEDFEIITVDEYFKRFSKPPEQPIEIGEYEVTDFTSEGFRVGCRGVSWEIYDKIGKRRPK